MKKIGLIFFCVLLLGSCQKKENTPEAKATTTEGDGVLRAEACSTKALEGQMNSALAAAITDADFTFMVERSDGRSYSYSRGNSTPQTIYESASTSKLVSAIIILRLVDQGILNLTDKPQNYITSWPLRSSDPLYFLNLAQLLSFTSGLEAEPLCLNAGFADFESCVNNIATTNAGNSTTPGSRFYYSSTHLQVAGLMAIKASGVSSWQNLFTNFKNQTGLFATAAYDLPSATNPRLAGGMQWKAQEYMAFLKALKNGALLSSTMQAQILSDQISNATIGNSPAINSLGEEWHYSFGLWHECQNATYNCTPGTRMSSPGAYGAYPFWDRQKNYFGILARQGALETFKNGATLERTIRLSLNEWAACEKE